MDDLNIKWFPAHANNYGVGRGGSTPNKIILHWIVGTLESADATFANPDRKASAHFGIGDSDIHQYVSLDNTAWHASNLAINRESVGIEHEGGWLLSDNKTRFKPTEATHQTSGKLVAQICKKYNIPIDAAHILPHKKYSNTECPGLLDIPRIIEIAKKEAIVTPPPDEEITDDEQNALDILEITKTENKFGNLEGTAAAGRGAIRDVESLKKTNTSLQTQLGEAIRANEEYAKRNTEIEASRKALQEELERVKSGKFTNSVSRILYGIALDLDK